MAVGHGSAPSSEMAACSDDAPSSATLAGGRGNTPSDDRLRLVVRSGEALSFWRQNMRRRLLFGARESEGRRFGALCTGKLRAWMELFIIRRIGFVG